ncbi:MAG TPA: sensor histidine kinase [bacterium]|nr:sensor histidine kinase [bacterium]
MVLLIAAADFAADVLLAQNAAVSVVIVTLFFIPVTYAAVAFDFWRATITAVWCVVVDVPIMLVQHRGAPELEQMFLLAAIVGAGMYVAYWVDREAAARAALRLYARAVVRGQEDERRRLAHDLHDETIQELMIHCRQLDELNHAMRAHGADATASVRDARDSAERIVQELRERIRALRPAVLDDLGLAAAIEQIVGRYRQETGATGEFRVHGAARRLSAETEVGLFRIAQEAVRNAERHARATRLHVDLGFDAGQVRLRVIDDGAGFVLDGNRGLAADGHFGLLGMRERAHLLDGSLDIRTSPRGGTQITVAVPG